MLEDVLGWFVVLVGALVMRFTNWYIIDPLLSIAVALFIIINTVKNLGQIGNIFVMKTPKNVDVINLAEHIKRIDKVNGVHHLHIWTIDGETHCATLHVVVSEMDSKITTAVKNEMREHGISHVTVEMETEECEEKICTIKQEKPHCHHHHH
jgi:cobalt-zinc-cadmium efflux system protein